MRLKTIILISILGVFLAFGSKVNAYTDYVYTGSMTRCGTTWTDYAIQWTGSNVEALFYNSADFPSGIVVDGWGGFTSNGSDCYVYAPSGHFDLVGAYGEIGGSYQWLSGTFSGISGYRVISSAVLTFGSSKSIYNSVSPYTLIYGAIILDTSSRIISVTPPDTSSSTSASPLPYTFSLDTYLSSDDFLAGSTTISYSLVNRDQGNILTGQFTATTSGETIYSGSVDIGLPNGFYQGAWNMQLPYSCGNGLDGGCYSPLLATSTSFVLGYSAIQTVNQDYLNATTTEKDCSQYTSATDPNFYLCPLVSSFMASIRWLFMPDQASIESVFNLFDVLKTKAPLGYFFMLKDSISGLSATSTPIVTYNSPVEIRDHIFTPIRTALSWLLWLFFAFNFYLVLKITRII